MQSLLKIGLTAALFLAIVVWAVGKQNSTRDEYEARLGRDGVRAEFLEKAPWVWSLEDTEAYRREVRGLFRWYVDALKARGSFREQDDDFLRELEEKRQKGQLRPGEYEGYKASYELVAGVWERIAKGTYAPVMTASSQSLRMDFLEASPAMVDGQRALKGTFVLWGAQRDRVAEKVGKGTQIRTQVHASFPDVQVKLRDRGGKAMGELTFGLPFGPYVPTPEQRVADFPPFGFVGEYAIPLVPNAAQDMEMVVSLVSKAASGSTIRGELVWKEPVPASWKLGEGEAWEGAGVVHREE